MIFNKQRGNCVVEFILNYPEMQHICRLNKTEMSEEDFGAAQTSAADDVR